MDAQVSSSGFWRQTNALFRKNLTFQMRNKRSNLRLVLFPVIVCLLLGIFKNAMKEPYDADPDEPYVQNEPPLLLVPSPNHRAVKADFIPYHDLPDESCRLNNSCPATILFTGNNESLAEGVAKNLFQGYAYLATNDATLTSLYIEIYGWIEYLNKTCQTNTVIYNVTFELSATDPTDKKDIGIGCFKVGMLWRRSASDINDELYKGYRKGNPKRMINEIMGAFDLLDSSEKKFNANIWYNGSYKDYYGTDMPPLPLRILQLQNLVSNGYLQALLGDNATVMRLHYVKGMPRHETELYVDYITSFVGLMVFTWAILQLFPVIVNSLVYEKQQKLRIIMKMHGLSDGPYLLISYLYHLIISTIYMYFFVQCGRFAGIQLFNLNEIRVQILFYFIYINLQIALAFLVTAIFSSVKTCTVIAYIVVFGTGLLGQFLFTPLVEDTYFPRSRIFTMELYPGFSLYRGLYELNEYAINGGLAGTQGMQWAHLKNTSNAMREVLIIMITEWLVVLPAAIYIDHVVNSGTTPTFFFTKSVKKKPQESSQRLVRSYQRQGSKVLVNMDRPDVEQERERVEQMMNQRASMEYMISHNIKKIYPGKDGNPQKYAVKGLSLVVQKGECFGLLGPNGAGKTTFINMMTGLIKPSYGTAYVQGLDVRTEMNKIYTSMGVCAQQDLLWETLSGRDHLLFYGRLKSLHGSNLREAVEESLKSINLLRGGFADKPVSKYSGGMKRRLSVAISLIGDPKVVYMDEPSTGLDPASRNQLWRVINNAKKDRAIILTTHSMEEAEELCDRLGIFVEGELRCLGNPNVLKARYEGNCVLTITTLPTNNEEVENMVRQICPNYKKTYHISGTQKFEMPKHDVKLADVFRAIDNAQKRFAVQAWGLSDTTLEDVFIKVTHESYVTNVPRV